MLKQLFFLKEENKKSVGIRRNTTLFLTMKNDLNKTFVFSDNVHYFASMFCNNKCDKVLKYVKTIFFEFINAVMFFNKISDIF